jgi:recombination protein RecA
MATKATESKKKAKTENAAFDILGLLDKNEKDNGLRNIELKARKPEDFISTGCLSLDLGCGGGYVGGRFTQFYGPPGSGKSTTAFTSAASLLNKKIPTLFFDHEATADKSYTERLVNARNIGFDFNSGYLRYYKPTDGVMTYESLLDIAQAMPDCDYGLPQLCVIIDSIAMMATPGEMEDWAKSKRMAQRAAMHSEWVTRVNTLVSLKNIAVIAVNQIRANPSPYASPVARPGGNAWEFVTANLIKVSAGKKENVGASTYQGIKFKTEKNKQAASNREVECKLNLGQGIDPASDARWFLTNTGFLIKEKKKFVTTGLDAVFGTKDLDIRFASEGALDAMIRKEVAEKGVGLYAACQELMAQGLAQKRYIDFLNGTLDVPPEDDEDEDDEDSDDEDNNGEED